MEWLTIVQCNILNTFHFCSGVSIGKAEQKKVTGFLTRNLNVYNCDLLGEVCSFEIFTRMPELTHWTLIFVCLIYFESSRIIRTKSVKVFFLNSPNPLSLLSRFTVKIDLQIGCTIKC